MSDHPAKVTLFWCPACGEMERRGSLPISNHLEPCCRGSVISPHGEVDCVPVEYVLAASVRGGEPTQGSGETS